MPPKAESPKRPATETAPETGTRAPSSWAAFWHTLTRFQSEKVMPWVALRNTIGVTLPLAVGAALGALPSAFAMSTGALNVSFSDGSDPYLQRARRMLLASLLVGIAVFIGEMCGGNHTIAVAVLAAWGFAAGMLVALGTTAADIGVISLVTVIVFSAEPMPIDRAISSGLFAFAGGLLQTFLALALWPVRRYDPERRALADLYLELARVSESPSPASQAPPASEQTTQAHAALAGLGREHSIEGERYRSLLNQAERMRLSLMTLGRIRTRFQRENPGAAETELLDRCFIVSSSILRSIGNSLLAAKPANPPPERLQELNALAEVLRETKSNWSSSMGAMIVDARFQIDALTGQLRSALDLAAYATPEGLVAFEKREARKPWTLRIGGTMAILRANLNLQSAASRHAVRLAVCVAVGDALGRGLGWRWSYWLPMTIAIVLKPDFTATFSRGVLRLAGTFAGLLLASSLFHWLQPGYVGQIVCIAICVFFMRCFGPANYGILVVAITTLVALLIATTGVAPNEVIAARGLNTAVGGAIALLAYWMWPTWERTQVSEALAQLLDTYRDYFRKVRESYEYPERSFSGDIGETRVLGRLARSNLQASVDRLGAEPGTSFQTMGRLAAILASSHRLAHAMMALESGLYQSRPVPIHGAFLTFANHIELTLYYLASALRGSSIAQSDLPDLREDHHALVASGDSLTERYALVNVETDRITNSLNTLTEQILGWVSDHPGSSGGIRS